MTEGVASLGSWDFGGPGYALGLMAQIADFYPKKKQLRDHSADKAR